MELSDYVGKLRGELTSITRFAGEDVSRAAELLTEALDSSVRLILLDVLSAARATSSPAKRVIEASSRRSFSTKSDSSMTSL